jgi:hypothetical protein
VREQHTQTQLVNQRDYETGVNGSRFNGSRTNLEGGLYLEPHQVS